ncbi:MAG: hypothetical protein HRU20_03915 [Pseudomonadales bacterium]|nr:hypothetical protein [Pseudomonadales bacterium]
MKNTSIDHQKKLLKQATQEYYKQHSLDAAALANMQTLLASSVQEERSSVDDVPQMRSGGRRLFTLAMAASIFCFVFTLGLWFKAIGPGAVTSDQMVEAIAMEVSKNHLKMKPLEVSSDDFSSVRDYFSELDFSPTRSDYFLADAGPMLGGRYCSIQGVTAAQLRYQVQGSNQSQSLYETTYDIAVFGELPVIEKDGIPIKTFARGLAVDIWVEKGLLMVSVRDMP